MSDALEQLIPDWKNAAGKVIALEARAGAARHRELRTFAAAAERGGARSWVLQCDFEQGGPWAGIEDLIASLVEEMGLDHELVDRHTSELVHAVPVLKRQLSVKHPTLTDVAPASEKVRNYPADRAYRIVHGLIDLLDHWKKRTDPRPWVVFCNGFERLSFIGRRFFAELMRRRGKVLPLTLVATALPGAAEDVFAVFREEERSSALPLNLPEDAPVEVDREAAAIKAMAIEAKVKDDGLEIQIHLPELFRLWRLVGRPDKIFRLNCWGLEIYNSQGFYEDARVYGERARKDLDNYAPGDDEIYWLVFFKLFMCNLGLHDGASAQKLVEDTKILERLHDPTRRGQLQYLIAMLHVRYLQDRDLSKGEEHLEEGLKELEADDVPDEYYHFFSVFNRNGLALVRHFQGDYEEAIELCRSGFAELEEHLKEDQHRLHRSVLLYNIGQVYEQIGAYEDAAHYYGAAMEVDPHYSEYYNDRGNVYLKQGRLDEALDDYRTAIDLSPPYHEVWTNLGQCYRRMERFEEAIEAFGVALDLMPERVLAYLGRAQCHEALGKPREALADYSAALELDPDLWDAHAGRAVLLFEMGEPDRSLADLDRAIELAPENADLYHNRAFLLMEMGEARRAKGDLESYLRLAPDRPDRAEVEARIGELGKALATA